MDGTDLGNWQAPSSSHYLRRVGGTVASFPRWLLASIADAGRGVGGDR